jgi:teichuronic acid biosynthesis glycosyltransferase TuaC
MHCCIISRHAGELNGVSTHVLCLAKYLHKLGHEVTVLAPDVFSRKENGITFIWKRPLLPYRNPLNPRNLLLPSFALCNELRNIHSRRPIDILHVHDSTAFLSANLFSRFHRIPTVFTVHSLPGSEQSAFNPGRVAKMYYFAERYVAKHASALICLSASQVSFMRRFAANSKYLGIVPNCVDLMPFVPEERAEISRISRSPSREICLFVGSMVRIKGLEWLVKAIPLVLRHRPRAFFVFVGDGPLKRHLVQMVQAIGVAAHTHFEGAVPREKVRLWYRNSSLFILPSLSEGQPQVILEAFADGLPVVATSVGGVPDLVREGWNGLLVPPKDEAALAQAICNLLDNDSLRKTYKLNALKTAKRFSWEENITRVVEIYSSLAAQQDLVNCSHRLATKEAQLTVDPQEPI